MNLRKTWIICITACLICAVGMAAFPLHTFATQTQVQQAQKKKTALEEQKKKTQSMLSELNSLKSDLNAYLKKLDDDLAQINEEIENLKEQITGVEGEIEKTSRDLEEAEALSAQQYHYMKLRIKYMYEQSNSSFLDMILGSDDLNQLLNRSEYVAKIAEYDRQQLDEYEALQARIRDTKQQLEDKKAELEGLEAEAEARQDSVETLLAEKKTELSKYNTQIANAQSELSRYEAAIREQENTIKAIEAEIKRKEEEARRKALEAGRTYNTVTLRDIKFRWPVPSSSRITSKFGDRESPVEGASTSHKGIDIGAPAGSDIVASAAGEVIISTYSPSAGNYLMINHGGGIYTVYMHASKLLVNVGDTVKQGQTIAKVGSTGISTGPHLHFGIRVDGNYVNPSYYVSP